MASGSLLPAFAEPAAPGPSYYMDSRSSTQNGTAGYPVPSGSGLGSGQMMPSAQHGQMYYTVPSPHQYQSQQQHQLQHHQHILQQQHAQQALHQRHPQQQQQPYQLTLDGAYAAQSRALADAESSLTAAASLSGGGHAQAIVYITAYGGVSVYESMIRNVAVMMRRADRWLNASQILKVAGISKVARAKIVDQELALGEHERAHAGDGKYQGLWVPYTIGLKIAQKYHVQHLLAPLFNLSPDISAEFPSTSSYGTMVTPQKRSGRSPSIAGSTVSPRRSVGSNGRPTSSRSGGADLGPPFGVAGSVDEPPTDGAAAGATSAYAQPQSAPQGHGLQSAPNMFIVPAGSANNGKRARSVSSQPAEPPSKRMKAESTSDSQLAPAFMPTVAEVEDGRAMSEPDVTMEEGSEAGSVAGSIQEQDRHPMPPNTILATRPSRPQMNAPFGVVKLEEAAKSRARVKLLAIFQVSEGEDADLARMLQPDLKSSPSGAGDSGDAEPIDIDQVIDEKGHTALHWACALARETVISGLISRGGDIHRGNFAGETPLIRAVLATNTSDANGFGDLLTKHLGSSLRTLDFSHRSVLHHIALVAAIKGRGASANAYMSALLEWQAQAEDRLSMQAFVNIQDIHGDTALIAAARVGNKNLVRLLLDAGADKTLANELGLRAVDFGIDVNGLECTSGLISAPSSQTSAERPRRKGENIIRHLTELIRQVNDDFVQEYTASQDLLEQLQGDVKEASHQLAVERRSLRAAQIKAAELEQAKQRIANLERAVQEETAFRYRPSVGPPSPSSAPAATASVDPPVSLTSLEKESIHRLAYLRAIRGWQEQTESTLRQRVQLSEGLEAEKEVQYKRVIAACASVKAENVDAQLLEDLTAAVESDGSALDLGRASAFMQRAVGATA